ncbi:MAG: DMT family transporter [Acetivibrio sp.]
MKKKMAVLGLILVTIIWGGGFAASDIALKSLTPFQIMTIRFFLATVILGGISLPQMKNIKKEEIRAGILMGVALFAGFALQIIGLQYTTPSKNAFLTATNVVMVPFIAFLFYKKMVGWNGIIGAVMAIIGVGVLSLEQGFSLGLGDALTLAGAVGFAFQIFLTGEFAGKYRVLVLNSIQMGTALFLSLLFLGVTGQVQVQATPSGWVSVLYLGIVSTSITYLLQTNCQKYVDETKAAIILSMESVFGTLFSVILLHESITIRMVAGCVIILAAVFLSNAPRTATEE